MGNLKKKICFFNSASNWGGGEKWHFEMARRTYEKGFDVCLCGSTSGVLKKKCNEERFRFKNVRVSNLSFLNPINLLRLSVFFRTENFDVVVFNLPSDLKTGGIAAKIAKQRNIIYRRGSAIPIRNTISNRFIFRNNVDYVIANSKATKETILSNNHSLIPENRIKVLYNGIDLSQFSSIVDKETVQDDQVVIGTLGRLEYEKNQQVLIEAMVDLKQEEEKVKLRIGGTGSFEEKLRRMAKDRGLEEYIDFVGFVDDVQAFMSKLDLFVLPSLWEGFGYVLVEAMACGKPIVAYDTGSVAEIVDDNYTGILVPLNDRKKLIESIRYMIHSRKHAIEMGEKGRERASDMFDIQNTTEEFIQFIQSM